MRPNLIAIIAASVCLSAAAAAQDPYAALRSAMVRRDVGDAGVADERVLDALRSVPRHEFVPAKFKAAAYFDMALAIGEGQTISPPFVVAYMTEQLDVQPGAKVLEIGTGSGYQAAVLAAMNAEVYSIEIVPSLGRRAARTLKRLGYDVQTKIGDGFVGWEERAPFDRIIVTCSPESVPRPLIEQLADDGRMIVPVGERYQQTLYLFEKQGDELVERALLPTLFVPMTGEAEERREVLPDPSNPAVVNGDLEKLIEEGERFVGWHYQRQAEVGRDDAEVDNAYARFSNETPGRGSQMLQGTPIDGRSIAALQLRLRVRGEQLGIGQNRSQAPAVAVSFFDEKRRTAAFRVVGPWIGSFDWQEVSETINVPPTAREAIIHLGLLGGVGVLDVDDVSLQAVSR